MKRIGLSGQLWAIASGSAAVSKASEINARTNMPSSHVPAVLMRPA
jgi:hypothetical protein